MTNKKCVHRGNKLVDGDLYTFFLGSKHFTLLTLTLYRTLSVIGTFMSEGCGLIYWPQWNHDTVAWWEMNGHAPQHVRVVVRAISNADLDLMIRLLGESIFHVKICYNLMCSCLNTSYIHSRWPYGSVFSWHLPPVNTATMSFEILVTDLINCRYLYFRQCARQPDGEYLDVVAYGKLPSSEASNVRVIRHIIQLYRCNEFEQTGIQTLRKDGVSRHLVHQQRAACICPTTG